MAEPTRLGRHFHSPGSLVPGRVVLGEVDNPRGDVAVVGQVSVVEIFQLSWSRQAAAQCQQKRHGDKSGEREAAGHAERVVVSEVVSVVAHHG